MTLFLTIAEQSASLCFLLPLAQDPAYLSLSYCLLVASIAGYKIDSRLNQSETSADALSQSATLVATGRRNYVLLGI